MSGAVGGLETFTRAPHLRQAILKAGWRVSEDATLQTLPARAAEESAGAGSRGGEFGWRVFVDAVVPPVAAVACFVAGALLIGSAVQPGLPARMQSLMSISPLALAEVSHLLASLSGMFLLFLAAGIWRRIDVAYWTALGVLGAAAVFSVLKGLNWEEALLLMLAAGALLPFRDSFYRTGRLSGNLLTAPGILAMLAVAGIALWLLLVSYENVPYQDDLWWTFLSDSDAPRSMRALAAVLTGGLLIAAWQLASVRQNTTEEMDQGEAEAQAARIFAEADDGHAEANLAFAGDKRFVFGPGGKSFVMYRPRGGLWVAMGDPVGTPSEALAALTAFHEAADRAGKAPVIYAASDRLLPALVELGYVIRKIGETACIDLPAFSLEGPSRARLRQARSRALRDGWQVEVLPPGSDVPWDALQAVSAAWLSAHEGREKSFSLGRFDRAYLARFPVAVVRKAGGAPVAFASLWPSPGRRELAVDLMRHGPEAPNGVMDFLFLEVIAWAKAQGFKVFDLGMAPLAGLKGGRYAPALTNVGQMAFDRGEPIYGFRGLRAYKSKFQPDWRPLFIAAPSRVSLPGALAAVALLTSGGVRGLFGLKG